MYRLIFCEILIVSTIFVSNAKLIFVEDKQANLNIQKFSLHGKEDCSDPGETYSSNFINLERISPLTDRKSVRCFCNYHGLWIFSSYKLLKPTPKYPIKSGSSLITLPGKSCNTRRYDFKYVEIKSIRHIGHRNTTVPALSLYQFPDYFGSELYIHGTSLDLPESFNFNSFGFTGQDSWTLYSERNYGGNSSCLNAERGQLLNFNPRAVHTVGSVKKGCWIMKTQAGSGKQKIVNTPIDSLTLFTPPLNNVSNTQSRLTLIGIETRLPTPKLFIEYIINGRETWSIYSKIDFSGKTRCLVSPGEGAHIEYRKKFRLRRDANLDYGETWLIGSIRKGCSPVVPQRELFSWKTSTMDEDYIEEDDEDYYGGLEQDSTTSTSGAKSSEVNENFSETKYNNSSDEVLSKIGNFNSTTKNDINITSKFSNNGSWVFIIAFGVKLLLDMFQI